MMTDPLTCRSLPEYLERQFPGYLAMIWAVRASNHSDGVTADLLISEVLVDSILADGVRNDDRLVLGRCFAAVELGLGSPDELLRQIVIDHVVSAVLSRDRWALVSQDLAGPLLRASLDVAAGASWRQQVGGFGPDELEPPTAMLMSGYLYRDEIFWHSGRFAADRSSIVLTEPFGRVSAVVGAYELGVAVAKMLDSLSRLIDETPRHEMDRFMSFVGCSDWNTFYAQSLSVELEGKLGSYEASLYPIHKSGYATSHIGRWPDEPLLVSDWREAAVFGSALSTAFRTATTDLKT